MRREPGQGEALLVWGLWALDAAVVAVTYSRVDPARLYHVSGDGLRGGLSRVVVLLDFPLALVAIALTLVGLAALGRGSWWVGVPAIALCAVTAVPGVVRQEDLDARWINAIPALGVVLALCISVAAAFRAGIELAPRLPGDPLRLVLGVALAVVSLPWISAELGFDLPGDVFLGEQVPAGETMPAVHLGHHHGLDGSLIVVSALLLSRCRVGGRVGSITTAYLSLAIGYGLVNVANDAWHEQIVKRGWVDWAIPSALEPGARPIWLVVLALMALAWWLLGRERAILRA